jgi:hypothetical protein
VRGEGAAHPALVDAVRAGDSVAFGKRAFERRREIAVRSRAERPLGGSNDPRRTFCQSFRHCIFMGGERIGHDDAAHSSKKQGDSRGCESEAKHRVTSAGRSDASPAA